MKARLTGLAVACLGLVAAPGPLLAQAAGSQETGKSETFWLELNRLEPANDSCRLVFVARNGLGSGLERVAFEVVVFDRKGIVSSMKVFDFGAMRNGKTEVKRFDLAGIDCADVARVLVNGSVRCEGAAKASCEEALVTGNRTEAEFGL